MSFPRYEAAMLLCTLFILCFPTSSAALRFDQQYLNYNLNQNQTATDVLDYAGAWENHTYFPSPSNWRIPFYTLFLDKYVNGDPTNDDINGTMFEHDVMQTQLRHGGDLKGLVDSLDYIQGMGIEAIYIAGTPFLNMPWGADGYSPLDLSLLDQHFGDIQAWRDAITEIHNRGMYIMLDNTMATMGDLIAFDGFLNASVPFVTGEHEVQYRDPQRQYSDFEFGNAYNKTCDYPRFWLETGFPVGVDVTDQLVGCYDSEFDQYGDFEGLGDFDGWKRSLSKAAGVQDRLREWIPSVRQKIEQFSCLAIMMLDIDGYRIDKATQVTVDALSDFSVSMRECAQSVGKENFFITGEVSGGNQYGSVFIGRGRQPDMTPTTALEAVTMSNTSNSSFFIRDQGENGLDSAAFHYSIYRSLTRLLGMGGIIEGPYDTPIDLVDAWNVLLLTNDMVNPTTGVFDPRPMFGTTNQDNFRWPAIEHGTEKGLLGQFLTTLQMPGIPLLLWGEEQAFYILDSTSDNYIFGRQGMSSAQAWKLHGCYHVGSSQYNNFLTKGAPALNGCNDDWNTLDHRDPANPVRNIIKSMYQMRKNYPVLNDGWLLQQLSNQTHDVFLPASNGTATEIGIWSTFRSNFEDVQDLSATGQGNQSVWLVYQNDNRTVEYNFNCSNPNQALVSPFDSNTTVKNLFYPFDEVTLVDGPVKLGIQRSNALNGCLNNISLAAWEYRAYVPIENFVAPTPMITTFLPGHDARLVSPTPSGQNGSIPIELHFSADMDCASVNSSITVDSITEDHTVAFIDPKSIVCSSTDPIQVSPWFGSLPTVWTFKANLMGVSDGAHVVTVQNAESENFTSSSESTDHFFIRVGQRGNPLVFPQSANYSQSLLHQADDKSLFISHNAAGATHFRYSLDWGSTYSTWEAYAGGNTTLNTSIWSGTSKQKWTGEHIIVQYFSSTLGSSDHIQHGDLSEPQLARRFPHLFLQGLFNQFGTDIGVDNTMKPEADGIWSFDLTTEWPDSLQANEWGLDPDGKADVTAVFGDIDRDGVLDRLPPSALAPATIDFNSTPPSPYLSWRLEINDGTLKYNIKPTGNRWNQLLMYILMWTIPLLSGCFGAWGYLISFYRVKLNKVGIHSQGGYKPMIMLPKEYKHRHDNSSEIFGSTANLLRHRGRSANNSETSVVPAELLKERRTVLIATMEYDIEDWAIKVKIGGLGVMAQLMGKNLGHQDLIWVVPAVGGIEYPEDTPADSMDITIMGKSYQVEVQYHILSNITYVILDAPIFRAQSKAEPYPERMDDMDSAIFYSAWNQCIALAIKRFQPDLYHINDYHGALAPVHLLPNTIPCILSLHNTEFQGLWGMRTPEEVAEVCRVYNIPSETAKKYVQFGDVFNLLHAGASYLRVHQKGFGAVGVSKKYGKRSWARYPIFWGLNKIGQLPNPDPSDIADWSGQQDQTSIEIDELFESSRGSLRRKAQEWAGLDIDEEAELLVFVGRWSMQKGIDLIADAMPAVLEENPKAQLICVGPVIDLYGKFAALKLEVLMKKYPGRVFSKPEFTVLPPFIFSGAEFALIPSRDEPFGLVAVEFGRKGALGIGARVGGLGQMPGWWFTVEATTTSHLLHQFKRAIKEALSSNKETRVDMRARSGKQRFPVAQWVEDLQKLQNTAIQIHEKEATCSKCEQSRSRSRTPMTRSCSPAVPSPDSYQRARARSTITVRRVPRHARSTSHETRRPQTAVPAVPLISDSVHTGKIPIRPSTASPCIGEPTRPERSFSRAGSSIGRSLSSAFNSLSRLDLDRTMTTDRARFTLSGLAPSGDDVVSPIESSAANSPYLGPFDVTESFRHDRRQFSSQTSTTTPDPATPQPSFARFSPNDGDDESLPDSPYLNDDLLLPPVGLYQMDNISTLSLKEVVGDKHDFSLQKVDPSFTDSTAEYFNAFKTKLRKLNASNSEDELCIEAYLVKSEKAWHTKFRAAKLGRSKDKTPATSVFNLSRPPTPKFKPDAMKPMFGATAPDEFQLDKFYKPPRAFRKYLQYRIGDWPLYTILLALGQIMGANSYQITLLSGPRGQNEEKFYIVSGIYLAASLFWWVCYRCFKSVHLLSVPFLLYGVSLLLLGVSTFFSTTGLALPRLQNSATALYTIASSSGSLYFALNFGDEGGSPAQSWVFRACVIQGTQQVYICALWFWGSRLSHSSVTDPVSRTIAPVLFSASSILFLIGIILYTGLPPYYRQTPGKLPSLYSSLFRRKIVIWFFLTVLIQNFFLSTLTARNWTYLWSSAHAQSYQIALLAIFFLVFLWAGFLWCFGLLARTHTWILPIFAIGLGAPRWTQILWACTPVSSYLPWTGSPLSSALVGRALWLWLGLLDALQGVGFGMILLQTLTRIHISATLIGAQILGASVTMVARAFGPDKLGPRSVFPDFSRGVGELGYGWFWVGLVAQMVICVGFFKFFRKEQLSKP